MNCFVDTDSRLKLGEAKDAEVEESFSVSRMLVPMSCLPGGKRGKPLGVAR